MSVWRRRADEANNLLEADFSLKLGDTPVAQVNADAIAGWVRLHDDVTVGVDEGLVAAGCRIWLRRATPTRRVARSRAPTARR